MRNCVLFDAGHKKVPRPHQFFGLKAAQERIAKREGGVIWHTQGSGKSILMVLIAKWLLEHDPEARILVVTDRDELDKQIEGVMKNAGVIGADSPSPRITSRAEFVQKLGAATPRLLCALVHKFDPVDLNGPPPLQGRFYVFVDECHRTQGGDMNRQIQYVERESHYLWGRRYLLTVREADEKPLVTLSHRRITLTVRTGSSLEKRAAVIHAWHKDLLEYVVVHEMLHLIAPSHSEHFLALMSKGSSD